MKMLMPPFFGGAAEGGIGIIHQMSLFLLDAGGVDELLPAEKLGVLCMFTFSPRLYAIFWSPMGAIASTAMLAVAFLRWMRIYE
jgi:hypothetical protein